MVNVGRGRHRELEIKIFGILLFTASVADESPPSGGLEENSDGWRFLLKAVMEAMRAGGAHGRDKPEMTYLCELWRG